MPRNLDPRPSSSLEAGQAYYSHPSYESHIADPTRAVHVAPPEPEDMDAGDWGKFIGVSAFRMLTDPVGLIVDTVEGDVGEKNLNYDAKDALIDGALTVATMGAGSVAASAAKTGVGQAVKQATKQAAKSVTKTASSTLRGAGKTMSKAVSRTGPRGKYVAVKTEEAGESAIKAVKTGPKDTQRIRPVTETGEAVTTARPGEFGGSARVVPAGMTERSAVRSTAQDAVVAPTTMELAGNAVKRKVVNRIKRKAAYAAGGNAALAVADPDKALENVIEAGINSIFSMTEGDGGEMPPVGQAYEGLLYTYDGRYTPLSHHPHKLINKIVRQGGGDVRTALSQASLLYDDDATPKEPMSGAGGDVPVVRQRSAGEIECPRGYIYDERLGRCVKEKERSSIFY
jgi:hypothetical protein